MMGKMMPPDHCKGAQLDDTHIFLIAYVFVNNENRGHASLDSVVVDRQMVCNPTDTNMIPTSSRPVHSTITSKLDLASPNTLLNMTTLLNTLRMARPS